MQIVLPPKKGRRKDPFIFRRTTVAAAAAFYTEITGLLNTAVSLAGAAWKMDSYVCNLVTKTCRLSYHRTNMNERYLNNCFKWNLLAVSPHQANKTSGAMQSISSAMCFKFLYSQLSVCSLLCCPSARPEWRDRFSIEWQMNSPLSDSERSGHISRPGPNNVDSENFQKRHTIIWDPRKNF